MADFAIAIQIALANEGLDGKAAKDNNGALVRYGINQAFNPNMPAGFYDGTLAAAPALAAAQAVYRSSYWNPIQGDGLQSQVLANQMLDCAINCGVGAAIQLLQIAANVSLAGPALQVDGAMGPKTLAGANASPAALAQFYAGARAGYYLAKSETPLGQGWLATWLARIPKCEAASA